MTYLDTFSDDALREIVSQSKSYTEVYVKLGYSKNVASSVSRKIRTRIKSLGIDTQCFKTSQSKPDSELFKKNSFASQHLIRNRYVKRNYSEYICTICGQKPIWNNKPLTLILDHIDGDNSNCELQNLRWVCPNCNQQLETTGYKKMRVIQKPKLYFCHHCGCRISKGAVNCNRCNGILQRSNKYPSKIELQHKLQEFNYVFLKVGKYYGVSDNAVRKWCKKYNLPYTRNTIK